MMQRYCQRFPPCLTLHCNLTTIHVAHCNSRYENRVGIERETMSLCGSQGWSTLEERRRQTNNYRADDYRDGITCPKRPSIERTSLVTRTDLAVTLYGASSSGRDDFESMPVQEILAAIRSTLFFFYPFLFDQFFV